MCRRLRQLRGMFEMTSSLLKSIRFLIFEAGDHFLRWGHSPWGSAWPQLRHSPHPISPLPDFPHCWPSRGLNTTNTHCSPLHCDRPRFNMAALGHLVLQRLPPVSEEGSFTKLGSMICPFVGRISCSASCDVTE